MKLNDYPSIISLREDQWQRERETDAALAVQLYIEHGLLAKICDWVRELHCMFFLQAYPTTEKDEEQVRSIHQLNVATNQYRNAVVLKMKYVPPTTWYGMIRERETICPYVPIWIISLEMRRSISHGQMRVKLALLLQRAFRYLYREKCCGYCPTILCELFFHFSSYSFFSSFVMPPMHWLVISPTTAPTHFRSSSTDDAGHRIWIRSLDCRRDAFEIRRPIPSFNRRTNRSSNWPNWRRRNWMNPAVMGSAFGAKCPTVNVNGNCCTVLP